VFKKTPNTENENCDKNSLFITRNWEGTSPACNCKNGVKSEIYKSKCSFLQIARGCKEISAVENKIADIWKGSKLCIKNHQNNYFDSITTIGDKCPPKYNLCGTDTKKFNLCFPKKYGCPINQVIINHNPTNEKRHIKFNSIKLNEDWYLHYSNQYHNHSLIIDVKYSEGRVCSNPIETNLKSHMKYKNILNSNSTCVSKIGKFNFDERFKVLDSISKFQFFNDNSILQKIEKLPQLNSQDLINYNSFIYHRSYIHWSPYCRANNELSPQAFLVDLLSLSQIDAYLDFCFYFFLSIYLFYTLSVILQNSINLLKVGDNLLDNTNFILFLSFLITTGLLIIILQNKIPIVNKFTFQKCSDYQTNLSFNELGRNLSELIIGLHQVVIALIISTSLLVMYKIIK